MGGKKSSRKSVKPKAAAKASPKSAASPKGAKAPKKATPAPLTVKQAALLKEIRSTSETERFDLISKADRAVVNSLLKKKQIQVRQIQKPDARGTIPVKAIQAAVKSVKKTGGDAGRP